MASRLGINQFAVLMTAILALGLSPSAATAQDGSFEFADLAVGTFGIMCLFVDQAPDADLAARLLGLHVAPTRSGLAERMLPGQGGTAWTLSNSARILMLARRAEDGACLMDVFGIDPSTLENALYPRMALMRSPTMAMVAEEIPGGFPRPPLRARYRLTSSQGPSTLVEMYVERQAGIPDRPVLIARPAPP